MKKWKTLTSLALIVALCFSFLPSTKVDAVTWSSNNTGESRGYKYIYNESNRVAKIIDYTGSSSTIDIPTELNGYKVIEIGNNAFSKNGKVTKVEIPYTVKEIGKSAFAACKKLESVEIASGVEEIGSGAFFSCPRLKSVSVPDSVKKIGQWALGFWQDDDDKGVYALADFVLKCSKGSAAQNYCDKSEFNHTKVKAKLSNWNRTPSAVKITSLSADSSTKATLKWKKDDNASGYCVVYSTSKNFNSNLYSVWVSGGNSTSVSLYSMSGKKTYYCKVAAYRELDGEKYFGSFSSAKKVTLD